MFQAGSRLKDTRMDRQKVLVRASNFIFSTGLDDSASFLARANIRYGLAKMHYIQQHCGLEPNATFVSSPDETVTRNNGRWNRGISYGGKITWGSGRENLVMLDVKPNACGMAVGCLDELPNINNIIKEIQLLEAREHYIGNIRVRWDFSKSNHFLDVLEVRHSTKRLSKYVVILHAGCDELKGKNSHGPGLYHDEDGYLKDIMHEIKTPFGPSAVLDGSHAREYMRFHNFAVDFAKQRRELALREIFGIRKFVANVPHQFMPHMNQVCLGCHDVRPGITYPISLRGDEPSFLVKGRRNFSVSQITDLGFRERAERLGVVKHLTNANILPHGGGYTLPSLLSVEKVFELSGERFFELNMVSGTQKWILKQVREESYGYRGLEVFEKTKRLGLCETVAELVPVYVVKI